MDILQILFWILAVIVAPLLVWVFIELLPGFAKVCLEIWMDKETGFLERYSMIVLGVMVIPCMAFTSVLLYSQLILTALGK